MMGTMSYSSPFRYDPTHILLQFQNQDGCQALGQAFLEEKLDDVDGFKVIDIERKYPLIHVLQSPSIPPF
jgi:hypothetical protein